MTGLATKEATMIAALLLSLAAHAAPAPTPAYGELVMTSPNSARALYQDTCSNGANLDEKTFDAFAQKVLDNPKSKLGAIKIDLMNKLNKAGAVSPSVFFGGKMYVFHQRDGCASVHLQVAMSVLTDEGSTDHTELAHDIVTFNDDDDSGVRTLSLVSIIKAHNFRK